MKYPFLASFLVFCAVFYFRNRKTTRQREKMKKEYFEREALANSTRKQPLDDLCYIKIPFDTLPMAVGIDDSVISECISSLEELKDDNIVNLTGLTNTDLKLQYGPANLPYLQNCDMCFTQLIRVLYDWAAQLYKLNYHNDSLTVLEYAVSINADISNIYYLAADIYIEQGTPEKIDHLIDTASTLNSVLKNSIIQTLQNKQGET